MIVNQLQPTAKTCGQTCVAMLLGIPVSIAIDMFGQKPTHQHQLRKWLAKYECKLGPITRWPRTAVGNPHSSLLRVIFGEKRNRTHWMISGPEHEIYDPGHYAPGHDWRSAGGRIMTYVKVYDAPALR